jgi:hypothetical protein
MRKTGILIFLLLLTFVIIVVVIGDFRAGRPGNRPENIYKLDVDQYRSVDTSLISHRETKNYKVKADELSGLAYASRKLYVAADQFILIFDLQGIQLLKIALENAPVCLDVTGDSLIIVGFRNQLGLFTATGEQLWLTDTLDQRAVITAVAADGRYIFAADAGNRMVLRYDLKGTLLGTFEGKTGGKDLHGFIIPSANFDLDINEYGELWVVNPGKHALENYTGEGDLRGYWENSSLKVDGFSGCCNPAHMTFLPGGSFVTSEKGLVRIKIHKPSGEFVSVVAPPDLFAEDGKAPDLATDENGNIFALDHEKKVIRLFQPK